MVWTMRRMLSAVGTNEGIELLLNRLSKTETNVQFLGSLTKSLEASDEPRAPPGRPRLRSSRRRASAQGAASTATSAPDVRTSAQGATPRAAMRDSPGLRRRYRSVTVPSDVASPPARGLGRVETPSSISRPRTVPSPSAHPSCDRPASRETRIAQRIRRRPARHRRASDRLRLVARRQPTDSSDAAWRSPASLRAPRLLTRPHLAGERIVTVTAVGLVALAIAVSNLGTVARGRPDRQHRGAGDEPRIALGGAVSGIENAPQGGERGPGRRQRLAWTRRPVGPGDVLSPDDRATIDGPFNADGTLVKPAAVDTTVADGAVLMRTYKVRSGDTLTGIARHFGVSMMTVWWANHLTSKNALHVGQSLLIPPVSGVVVKVTAGRHARAPGRALRGRPRPTSSTPTTSTTRTSSIGQTLTIPGARAAGIATPKPTKAPTPEPGRTIAAAASHSGSGSGGRPPAQYTRRALPLARRGRLHQPVLPLRPLRDRHRGRPGHDGDGGGERHGDLRRLEEQRRRLPGLDRPRLEPVHDVQPHVVDHRRTRPVRRPRRSRSGGSG